MARTSAIEPNPGRESPIDPSPGSVGRPTTDVAAAGLNRRRRLLVDGALALSLLATIVAVTSVYVSNEHTIYASDYGGYQNITLGIVSSYHESIGAAMRAIALSTTTEYNALFTIPLIPWILTFGESRMVFDIALAVVYLFPFTVIMGAIAATLIPTSPRLAFWSTVVLTLLTPMAWVPTLRGYPDTGGAVLMLLAVWVCLRDMRLERWWHIPLLGFLITTALLFRRHFAYAAIAFLMAMVLHMCIGFAVQVGRGPRQARRELRVRSRRVGWTIICAVLVLVVLGHPFLVRALTTDYNDLYADYMQPLFGALPWYAGAYGWPVLLAAAAGFMLGGWTGVVKLNEGAFVALFGGLTVLAWLLVARQTGEQYTLNFTPLVVLGLAALLWSAARRSGRSRVLAPCIIVAYMAINTMIGLTDIGIGQAAAVRPLFATQEAPFTRTDQREMTRLIAYLRALATHGEPVFVAASSSILSADTVYSAERQLYGWDRARLNVLLVPAIDSRDFLPLEMLVQASYVAVADPFQQHLGVEKQRVVKVVYDLFTRHRDIARDFTRLPATFVLDQGVAVRLYKRIRPTAIRTALSTLRFMQSNVQTRPGGQLDWIVVGQAYPSSVTKNSDSTYTVRTGTGPPTASSPSAVLYLGPWPDKSVLSGTVVFPDRGCPGAMLRLSRVTAHNQISHIVDIARRANGAGNFTVAMTKASANNLLLTVLALRERARDDSCTVDLDHLRLRPNS